jgi:MFS family permease
MTGPQGLYKMRISPKKGSTPGGHVASALGGATPTGGIAEPWIVAFRALQGLGGALMFPAALAIVVQTFDLHSRGRALALFSGVAGGLTAIGPVASAQAAKIAQLQGGNGNPASIIRADFAGATAQLAGEDPDADLYPAPR